MIENIKFRPHRHLATKTIAEQRKVVTLHISSALAVNPCWAFVWWHHLKNYDGFSCRGRKVLSLTFGFLMLPFANGKECNRNC